MQKKIELDMKILHLMKNRTITCLVLIIPCYTLNHRDLLWRMGMDTYPIIASELLIPLQNGLSLAPKNKTKMFSFNLITCNLHTPKGIWVKKMCNHHTCCMCEPEVSRYVSYCFTPSATETGDSDCDGTHAHSLLHVFHFRQTLSLGDTHICHGTI